MGIKPGIGLSAMSDQSMIMPIAAMSSNKAKRLRYRVELRSDPSDESARSENIFRIEGILDAAHKSSIAPGGSPNIHNAFQGCRAQENRCGAITRGRIFKYA